MNLEEVLKLTDELVFASTGKHLNDLQKEILHGTWQHEDYNEIAKKVNLSEARVREVGMELWQILSNELGEKVTKSNFKAAMERLQNANLVNFAKNVTNSFNICEKSIHLPDIPNPHPQNEDISDLKSSQTLHHDLSEMPDFGVFYDRTPELDTLTTWILQQRCRLIAITGIRGIGKTALTVQLVQQIKDKFEFVFWCSLEPSQTLTELQAKLIEFFSESEPQKSSTIHQKPLTLIKFLQQYRCLIILDDIHNLFVSGELAGKYQPGYEDYRHLFKQIETLSHQSCFLLIGWEQPREVTDIKNKNSPVQTLRLRGLDPLAAREIIRDCGLAEIESWETIIHYYQGNPLWLKIVGTFVQELGGCVTELLADESLLLPEDLKDVLQQQFNRLSAIEKQVLSLVAKESEPVNLAILLEHKIISSSDLLNALQSLSRRCLIEPQGRFYSLSPVLRQFIKLSRDF
ncbi:ATP-binding protein [Limnoraphis robusta]|uniref:ATP-binding protein n=1 Tax=Limnoraphis robusta CCNP1315 TaxID=3110306 RepID=A0ABU5TZZ6_9CYAN|nr:ATP-binding protein [Limnoraphis robusta]MEA5520507.1 ATP-binding protein [Limnoraphis robusta CCNP1315]MEA5547020.1 ATP-binding protein [Limnoraphis robusta CCNP1324]